MKELIDYFEQFLKLNEAEKNAILSTCSIIKVKKQDILEELGTNATTLYFLKSGVVRIYYYKDGIDVTEFFALAGNLVARVKSLLTQQPSSKAIQILEDGELVAIDMKQFTELFDLFPTIERLYLMILETSYVAVVERVESIQFHSAKERYAALLLKEELLQKVPLKYIASYLGITQVSLSRIRANQASNKSEI